MKLSRFAPAAKNFEVATPFGGASRWLPAGRHAVTIEDSNAEKAEATGKIEMSFRGDGGETHKDSLFIMSVDAGAWSSHLRMLLGATLPDLAALSKFNQFMEYAETATRVLESFRGMRVLIELRDTDGYRIDFIPAENKYVAVDTDGAVLGSDIQVSVLAAQMKANGYTRSFRRVERIEVLDESSKELNLQAFNSVIASIEKATPAPEAAEDNQFAGYSGPSSGE